MSSQTYLSSEAENLLSLICKEYYIRITNGESPTDAKAFGSGEQFKKDFKLKCKVENIVEYCRELHKLHYVDAVFSSDKTLVGVYLSHRGIEYISNLK